MKLLVTGGAGFTLTPVKFIEINGTDTINHLNVL